MSKTCMICYQNYEGDKYEHIRRHLTDFETIAHYISKLEERIDVLENRDNH
jgi:hypothetical protein